MTDDSPAAKPEGAPIPTGYGDPAQPSVVYQSYLLRLWHDSTPYAPWRAMLQSVNEPGERQNFSDLESLFAFLRTQSAA